MLSFLEFYLEMMKFVLFKLESDLARDEADREAVEDDGEGVARANAEDFASGAALTVLDVGANPAQAKEVRETATKQSLLEEELRKVRGLFRGLTFYLSREVPAKHLGFVINACGGRVATDYVPSNITHVVVDRPALAPGMAKYDTLEYVQPQYIFDCLNARLVLPVTGYRMGEELPPHVSPFSVSITNDDEDNAAVEQVKKDHPKIVGYVPQRVHEIRKLINPAYSAVDPEGKVAALEEEYSDDEAHVAVPEEDLEEVTEEVQRSTLSALKVKNQREMNLMNAPTNEVVARRRQALRKSQEQARQNETSEARLRRKMGEMKKQEQATRKMQLQVARKKAARFYKMGSGVVHGAAKKAAALETKAKHIKEGKLQKTQDGTGLANTRVEARRQRALAKGKTPKEKKVDNPYKKLPKWVR